MKNFKYYLINGKTLIRESGKFIKTVEAYKNGIWIKNRENAEFLRGLKNRADRCGETSCISEISITEAEKFLGTEKEFEN